MLPLKHRLKKEKDIKRVIQEGIAFWEKGFLVLKKNENGLGESRFAFVVSRRISVKAVVRNKIKRRIREATRSWLKAIKPGYDVVFFAQKGIVEKNGTEIREIVENLLKKADLLREE